MKTIQVGDFEHKVTIEPDPAQPGGFRGKIGERDVKVELRPGAGAARVLVVDGRVFDVAIARDRDRTWVQLGAEAFQCETVKVIKGPRSARGGGGGKKDPIVKSPIAGKVLKVFVAVGDSVIAGQKLISIEAMKMENEIHATLAGTVKSIAAQAGAPIQPGDVLLELEPAVA